MKIRSGFVSNSSSSSFVAVGFDVDPADRVQTVALLRAFFDLPTDDDGETEDADDLYYAKRDSGIWYMTSEEAGSPRPDQHVVCLILTENRGYTIDPIQVPVGDLPDRIDALRVAFGAAPESVKLYVGTRAGYM